MSKTSVYEFTKYDINQGKSITAKRMATLEAIKNFGGTPNMDTATEVDATEIDENGHYPKTFKVIYSTKAFPVLNINQIGKRKVVEYSSLEAAKSSPFPTDEKYISAMIQVVGGVYTRSYNSNEWAFQENTANK
jgi:hypothetical protein